MSARNELAEHIATALDSHFGIRPTGAAGQDYHLADSLVELGYSKPRKIHTPAEVDALPEGTVVMTRYGDGVTIYRNNVLIPAAHYHFLVEDGGHATVLHEPGQVQE